MNSLADSDALIFDLRDNRAAAVAWRVARELSIRRRTTPVGRVSGVRTT
jgi:hypothetical protein